MNIRIRPEEAWLAEHRQEIGAKIEEGLASARRGQLLDSDSVRGLMDERKTAWLAERHFPGI
jgi:predicted transcriptional regulator